MNHSGFRIQRTFGVFSLDNRQSDDFLLRTRRDEIRSRIDRTIFRTVFYVRPAVAAEFEIPEARNPFDRYRIADTLTELSGVLLVQCDRQLLTIV